MDEMKKLLPMAPSSESNTKPQASAELGKPSPYSKDSRTAMNRPYVLGSLIQKCRRRSGLALLEDDELKFEIGNWEEVLASVPDAYIERAAQSAMESFDWLDQRKEFQPDAIRLAYPAIVKADREREEK